jgi:hypothetical protein
MTQPYPSWDAPHIEWAGFGRKASVQQASRQGDAGGQDTSTTPSPAVPFLGGTQAARKMTWGGSGQSQVHETTDRSSIDKAIASPGGKTGTAEVHVKFDNAPKDKDKHKKDEGKLKDVNIKKTPSMAHTGSTGSGASDKYAAEE